jgi:predicted lysophospholipase L1 biosynthesis ABC-type transport system permease subunit
MDPNLVVLLILAAMTAVVGAVVAVCLSERVRELGLFRAFGRALAGDTQRHRYGGLIR